MALPCGSLVSYTVRKSGQYNSKIFHEIFLVDLGGWVQMVIIIREDSAQIGTI
jgi:hypothetical protein